jgi:hypothetical protein
MRRKVPYFPSSGEIPPAPIPRPATPDVRSVKASVRRQSSAERKTEAWQRLSQPAVSRASNRFRSFLAGSIGDKLGCGKNFDGIGGVNEAGVNQDDFPYQDTKRFGHLLTKSD